MRRRSARVRRSSSCATEIVALQQFARTASGVQNDRWGSLASGSVRRAIAARARATPRPSVADRAGAWQLTTSDSLVPTARAPRGRWPRAAAVPPLPLRSGDDHQRAPDVMGHVMGDRPEQEPREPAEPPRSEHDQVGARRGVEDGGGRAAAHQDALDRCRPAAQILAVDDAVEDGRSSMDTVRGSV